jgi:DNA-binding MarR family transcriptional regulator
MKDCNLKIPSNLENAKYIGAIILSYFFATENNKEENVLNFNHIRKITGINKSTLEKNLMKAIQWCNENRIDNYEYIKYTHHFFYKNQEKQYIKASKQEIYSLIKEKLNLTEIGTYFIIKSFRNNKTLACFPSYQAISLKSKISTRQVQRIVKKLIDKQLIKKYFNNYVFMDSRKENKVISENQ